MFLQKTRRKQPCNYARTQRIAILLSAILLLTGMKAGTAKIYAVSRAGIRSGSCTVVVKKKQQTKPDPDLFRYIRLLFYKSRATRRRRGYKEMGECKRNKTLNLLRCIQKEHIIKKYA